MSNNLKAILSLFVKILFVLPIAAQSKNVDTIKIKEKKLLSINVNSAIITPVTFVLSKDHYSKDLSFFCRKELQIEKITRIPFRFRLGSVEYCDKMEGKRQ
jgi:hypothetical protein